MGYFEMEEGYSMRRIVIIITLFALLLTTAGAAATQNYVVHIVQRGETLFRIALRYGTTVSAIASANGIYNINRIYVGQRLIIPAALHPRPPLQGTTIYIVGRGDYLAAIAARFGTSVSAIVAVNGIRNPNLIYVGQQLIIPIG